MPPANKEMLFSFLAFIATSEGSWIFYALFLMQASVALLYLNKRFRAHKASVFLLIGALFLLFAFLIFAESWSWHPMA
jgi:hypothetical protein